MNVLLSIKPKYVDLILNGKKKYEFRRKIFRNETNKVYVYCTSPVKKIVAYFTIENILESKPTKIWEQCKDESGLSSKEFFNYFKNSENAFAIKIGNVRKIRNPVNLEDMSRPAPQSFYYVDKIDFKY